MRKTIEEVTFAVMQYVTEVMDLEAALPDLENRVVISMGGQPRLAERTSETFGERRARLDARGTV